MTQTFQWDGASYTVKEGMVSMPVEHLLKILQYIEDLKTQNLQASGTLPYSNAPEDVRRRIDNGGSPIRVYRRHRGLTQKELARATGISTSMLSEMENGIKQGSLDTIRKIAQTLNADVRDLIP